MLRLLITIVFSVCVARAQITLASTTMAAPAGSTQQNITMGSGAAAVAGQVVLANMELMGIQSVNGRQLNVTRGANSTTAVSHVLGTTLWIGPLNAFVSSDPAGACVRTSLPYVPVVAISTGNAYDCIGSVYVLVAGSISVLGVRNGGTGSNSFTPLGCVSADATGLHLVTVDADPCGTGGGGGGAFSALTSGTNTVAAMVVGSGASLTTSGGGTINANRIGAGTGVVAVSGGAPGIVAGTGTDCVLVNANSAPCGNFQSGLTGANATGAVTLTRTATVQTFNLTLTGDVSGFTLASFVNGDTGVLKLTQDSTPRTVVYGSSIQGGSPPCVQPTSTVSMGYVFIVATMYITSTSYTGCAPALISSAGNVINVPDVNGSTLANLASVQTLTNKVIGTGTSFLNGYPMLVSAPSGTPGAGAINVWADSTSKNWAIKDDAGVTKHAVQTATCAANNHVSAITDAGGVTCTPDTGSGVTISTAGGGYVCIADACNVYNGILSPQAIGTVHRVYLYPIQPRGANFTIRHASFGVGNLSAGVAMVLCLFANGTLVTNGQARLVGVAAANAPSNIVFTGDVSLAAGTLYQVGVASENTSTTFSPGITDLSLAAFNVGSQTIAGYATTGLASGTGTSYACPATTGGTTVASATAPTGIGTAPGVVLMP